MDSIGRSVGRRLEEALRDVSEISDPPGYEFRLDAPPVDGGGHGMRRDRQPPSSVPEIAALLVSGSSRLEETS